MITTDIDKHYPSAKMLMQDRVASRLQRKDATLYDFSPEAQTCAENFMGWADLASQPPYPLAKIQAFADDVVASGIQTVVLIGQGGSTQAAGAQKNRRHGLRAHFAENVFSHPDCNRRFRNSFFQKVTGSAASAGHGLYQGLSPCHKDFRYSVMNEVIAVTFLCRSLLYSRRTSL